MIEKYVSECLIGEIPKPLINFIWYLWEAYCPPTIKECQFLLQTGENGQRVTIPQINKSFEQDFGTAIDVVVLIRREMEKCYMSRR